MIKIILWDIDGTILDFRKAESTAIRKCFEIFNMGECNDCMMLRYSEINDYYWKKLERGEISKKEVLLGRFQTFFKEQGLMEEKAFQFNEEYQYRLGDEIFFNDNGYELINKLKGRVKQYIVTNGTKKAQDRKLEKSGLIHLVDGTFISDEIGAEKPSEIFFEKVWKVIGQCNRDEVLIVGDSLTSDMKGGNNEGIKCCWYNPEKIQNTSNVKIDWEITDLWQVLELV